MHFITFPVATTNIFPLVNSKNGGQLATEYNLKSREIVATNPAIIYPVGPSYIHSLNDFRVKPLENGDIPEYSDTSRYTKGDYCTYNNVTYICIVNISTPEPFNPNHWSETTITAANSIIQVGPGRAVINGHYVESLAPINIDLNAVNAELVNKAMAPLYGTLSIGIKSYFSTSTTMSGTMLVENAEDMYLGIQIVIEKASDFKTPNDSPLNPNLVNADIKLADFSYVNGVISKNSIIMNPGAMGYIPSERIANFNNVLDDKYVTSENLVDRMFYTYSGKSGWCDSTDNLMIWDNDSEHRQTTVKPTLTQAEFIINPFDGSVHLVVPHKQQDGEILNDNGDRLYYADRDIKLPTADYNTESSGIVTAAYTKHIKAVEDIISTYKQFTNGKQVTYWESLKFNDIGQYDHTFPDPTRLNVGDYIVVREDYTIYSNATSSGSAPTTMYFVLPGAVTSIEWVGTERPSGIQLGTTVTWWSGDHPAEPSEQDPAPTDLNSIFGFTNFIGTTDDYFVLEYRNTTDVEGNYYYYKVSTTSEQDWSSATSLNGGIYLATESQLGGFFNVSTDYTDAGYVYLDNTGHLRLLDYALLRSGTLAYQLGESYAIPTNSTLPFIQNYLDEHVNSRVAFPFKPNLTSNTPMIDVTITITDGEGVINLYNIDSRFGTGVYLHIRADDKTKDFSNVVINISDCQKIRIDSSIADSSWVNGPMINIFRSGLYYDAQVINYIRTCDVNNQRLTMFSDPNFTGFKDMSLWYAQILSTDPDLSVNGMEVSSPNIQAHPEEISFWDETIIGDNHYKCALRSITMSSSGEIIGCSLYVSNNSTQPANINTTQHVIIGGDFILPQGDALNYPEASLNHALQVTGVFTTAYLDTTHTKWITTETSFTARTGIYSVYTGMGIGSIAFNSKTDLIDTIYSNVSSLDGWEPGTYHIFYGGTSNVSA